MSTGRLAALAPAAGVTVAGYVYPPVRLFAEKAVGRGTGCPMGPDVLYFRAGYAARFASAPN
jgi:hypothetical protein